MDESIVTPERLAKGDLQYSLNAKGEIVTAQVTGNTWAHWLQSRGVLNHFDVSNADWFRNLHEAFSYLFGRYGEYSKCNATGEERTLADQYITLLKCLNPLVLKDIQSICCEQYDQRKASVMWVNRGRWISAMQKLDKALTTN
jgi:hypothetical protein